MTDSLLLPRNVRAKLRELAIECRLDGDLHSLETDFHSLEISIREELGKQSIRPAQITVIRTVHLRYAGSDTSRLAFAYANL